MVEIIGGAGEPVGVEFGVGVEELEVRHFGMKLEESLGAGVAGAGGGEGEGGVEGDDVGAVGAGEFDGIVGGVGVDVDDVEDLGARRGADGIKAGGEVGGFVAADDDDGEGGHRAASSEFRTHWPTPSQTAGFRMMRAGMPTAMAFGGTSVRTTALAPMAAWSPMWTLPRILAPAPTLTDLPRVGAAKGLLDGAVPEGDTLAEDAVVADDGLAVDDDGGLVFDDDAAAELCGVREFDAVVVADVAEEGAIEEGEGARRSLGLSFIRQTPKR